MTDQTKPTAQLRPGPTLAELAARHCESYTGSATCADDPDRSADSPYGATGYCYPCLIRNAFHQPNPTAEPVTNEQAWDDGFEAGATWPQHTASGIPVDPPLNPYESTTEPPRIEDLAPGTTFLGDTLATRYGSRWTVLPSGRVESGMGIGHEASEIDPSTIRDVTPPAVNP